MGKREEKMEERESGNGDGAGSQQPEYEMVTFREARRSRRNQ